MEDNLVTFLAQYKWLLDSYVIEFFTEDHWAKVPHPWREALCGTDLRDVAQLLLNSGGHFQGKTVYPLSLLSFCATAHSLLVSREQRTRTELDVKQVHAVDKKVVAQIEGLDHLFRRHVKPKKQHEIKLLGKVISEISCRTNCRNIIVSTTLPDVGSGQGHLARYLAYNYGLNVIAMEAVGCHLTVATKFDSQVEEDIAKKGRKQNLPHLESKCTGSVRHIETLIDPDFSASDLLSSLHTGLETDSSLSKSKSTLQDKEDSPCPKATAERGSIEKQKFILVGLHTCGDLASTMLRMFSCSDQIVGLVSVGCCYMKLTCSEEHVDKTIAIIPSVPKQLSPVDKCIQSTDEYQCERLQVHSNEKQHLFSCSTSAKSSQTKQHRDGYPMSTHVRSLPGHSLSYEAREVACHSIEVYFERCQDSDSIDHLKIHCHRAAVETILRKHGLRRAQVRISKRISKLPFEKYAQILLQNVGLPALTVESIKSLCHLVDSQWENVAKFFMLRLALAPCVESLIMLDRVNFLREQGCSNVQLVPLFNPKLSPRNLVVIAT